MSGRAAMLSIPRAMRAEVDDRDGLRCRVCGQWAGDARQQHHIHYGGDYVGMGGRRLHAVDNIITLDMEHHDMVHRNKGLWVPVLEELVHRPATTGFALRRRAMRRSTGVQRSR